MTTRSDISKYLDKTKYKSVLCLDGKLPKKEFLLNLNLPIIAADGAANKLVENGIKPHLIIGDCDSVNEELLDEIPHKKLSDQNTSDFQKAIIYMEKANLLPSIICGISGGYLDHIINNVRLFTENSENVFVDEDVVGFNLTAHHQFNFPLKTKLSIIGMPNCKVTTRGLKWELQDFELSFPGASSYFNRTVLENVEITIHKGKAIMIVYRMEIDDAGLKND